MINFIYDGSFEGLLTAVYESYYGSEKPDNIIPYRDFNMDFLSKNIYITSDNEKYKKVYFSIQGKISKTSLENVYYAFLSEAPNSSNYIYQYLKYGWKIGGNVDRYLTDERVINLHRIAQKVTNENHRMLGLLRFKKIKGNIYYAAMEPDHNIMPILAPHFADRLSDQRWIIHDVGRGIAAIYNKRNWVIETIYSKDNVPLDLSSIKEIDIDYENLWKLYHKHISIDSRKNIKLQKQHMPTRYWYYLTEKIF